jgi:hypothetical protein
MSAIMVLGAGPAIRFDPVALGNTWTRLSSLSSLPRMARGMRRDGGRSDDALTGLLSDHPRAFGGVPKNISSTLSLPITRTSSCIVQYIRISTTRMIWMAQKCGHTIPASNFW